MVQVRNHLDRFQHGVATGFYFLLRLGLSLGVGFLAAKCTLFDSFSPFALILLSVSPRIGLMPTFCYLGSAVGYLTGAFELTVFKYITALTMVYIIYMVLCKSMRIIKEDTSVLTAACCFTAGFLFLMVGDLSLFSVLLLLGESVLICCCVYFISYAVRGFRKCCYLSARELIAAAITLILILASLHNITLFHMSIARIVAIAILFLALCCLKTSHAAVLGSCLGMILAVVGSGGEAIFTAMIVGTLVGCVFSNFSDRFSLISFILVYFVVLFFFGKFPWNYWYFSEPLASYALVFFVPKKRLRSFLGYYIAVKAPAGEEKGAPSAKNLLETCRRECESICPQADKCYMENAAELAEALDSLTERFCRTEDLGNVAEALPFCTRVRAMAEIIEKRLVYSHSEDFEDLVEQLNHLSRKMELKMDASVHSVRFLTDEESAIRAGLEKRRIHVKDINFIIDERDCKKCDIQCTADEELLYEKIVQEVAAPYFGTGFTIKTVRQDGELAIHLKESSAYQISCAALCKTKSGEQICGDNALGFSIGRGVYYLILADGMGSGKEASLQSELVIETIRRLVSGGLSVPNALNVYQSASRFRQESSFTTIDICRIDLNSGTADFYKAGAFDSFHLRENRIAALRGGGMPLGLSENDRVRHLSVRLADSDYLILASDGLSALNEELESTLVECRNANVRVFAQKILQRLSETTGLGAGDDVTIMVCKFQKTAE